MSSLIQAVSHALGGHGENSDKMSNVHTVVCDDVKVKSTVNCETHAKTSFRHSNHKINELMSKLSNIK